MLRVFRGLEEPLGMLLLYHNGRIATNRQAEAPRPVARIITKKNAIRIEDVPLRLFGLFMSAPLSTSVLSGDIGDALA